jgi:hypothetical protein
MTTSPISSPFSKATKDSPAGLKVAAMPVVLYRRSIDVALVSLGVVAMAVLAIAGGLLTWGSNFSKDYVSTELSSQNIRFGDAASLQKEGRNDLSKYAGKQLKTGPQAQAYASYINGHLEKIGGGKTFAELGETERVAKGAMAAAVDAKQTQVVVDGLAAKATAVTETRNALFKGETLRGLLLSAYAWSTVGRIAGIAAISAFVASAVMALLVILGIVHVVRRPALQS